MRDYLEFLHAPDEFHRFLDEFQRETDRAAAVLGGAYLDDRLGDLLASSFAEETQAENLLGPMQPIGSFGARISVAHAVGLVTLPERRDLDRVRQIRNRFAHRLHGLDFGVPEIADRCRAFECNEERFEAMEGLRDAYPQEPRLLFNLAVGLLGYYLERRVVFADRFLAAHPPLWPFPGEERPRAPVTQRDQGDRVS